VAADNLSVEAIEQQLARLAQERLELENTLVQRRHQEKHALVLPAMKGWSGPLAIFAMQPLLLFVFARRYGVKELPESVDRLVAMAKAATPGHTKP
jgi:hypothetical protein